MLKTVLCVIILSVLVGVVFYYLIQKLKEKKISIEHVKGALFSIMLIGLGYGLFHFTGYILNTTTGKPVNDSIVFDYVDKTHILVEAIREVESGGDSTAVNSIGATGDLQLLPAFVKEAREVTGIPYTNKSRLSSKQSEEIFHIIQAKYNPKGDMEVAIRLWNGGPTYSKASTDGYYRDVMREYNKRVEKKMKDMFYTFKNNQLWDNSSNKENKRK